MKNKIKNYAFGTFVLLLLTVPFISVLGQNITINQSNISPHIVRLYQLTIGGVKIFTKPNFLNISHGIVVGNIISSNTSNSASASIGGGDNNIIQGDNAGIAGGQNNEIDSPNALIGGGESNKIISINAVVAGGQSNIVNGKNGVILGGQNNTVDGEKGIVLGGTNNTAGASSLVMGKNATGLDYSFSWNANAGDHQARIDAESGILIGTVEPIAGVNLVVSGAVRLSSNDNISPGIAGEIRVINGCFYAYDGLYWHVISQGGTSCNALTTVNNQTCNFGNIKLQAGDQVTGYNNILASNNTNKKCNGKTVTCSGGKLRTADGDESYQFPYCYDN